MTLDFERARCETPGVGHVAHLNNAGAALPPVPVTDAVIEHLRAEARIGGYEAAELAADRVESTSEAIARLLGCGTTRWPWWRTRRVPGIWRSTHYGSRRAIASSPLARYASNVIAFLQVARRTGAVMEVVDDDEGGQVSVDDLRR